MTPSIGVPIRKISPPGVYFSKALKKVLIFGGAHLRKEICVAKSIELALYIAGSKLTDLLCFTLYLRVFQVQVPGRLIFGGAIERRVV